LVIDKNTSEVVVYKRKKPTETRLVDNCSIGWGGHI
jgi:predicted NUDIX family phosphoesterase